MRLFDRVSPEHIESRELQLILLACAAIVVLAAGLALLMYPAVFSQDLVLSGRTVRIAFFGFCGLSVLLVGYLLDRQFTISRLRRAIAQQRTRAVEVRRQASADLLKTLPNLSAFQDRLPMEYRRAASTEEPFSILMIVIHASSSPLDAEEGLSLFGDATKAVARKLREQDSIYLFCQGYLGVILPAVDVVQARQIAARLTEGLSDAAGLHNRFAFEVHIVSYPEQGASAQELQQAVCSFLPDDVLKQVLAGVGSA